MLLTLLLACPLLLQDAAPADPRANVREAYHAAWEARDAEALAATWREHPDLVLTTFDADLEAGLAAWEKRGEGHEARTAELFTRAAWGAEVAADALDRPILGDYANAFRGWTDEERKRFRRGQAAFGEARKALSAGDFDEGLARARECHGLAVALGDWWGTAMGLGLEGSALGRKGEHAEAAAAFSRARLLNHQLGLVSSEYRALHGLAGALHAAGAHRRAHRACADGIALATTLGDAEGRRKLLGLRLEVERALGDAAAADATRAELEGAGR